MVVEGVPISLFVILNSLGEQGMGVPRGRLSV